jgi:uncharacterized membrane protein YkvA (DUF1232 family)
MTNSDGHIYIRDLKNCLKERGISPEAFAQEVQLSHMTIRRWLKRKPGDVIPEKYYPMLRVGFSQQADRTGVSPALFDVSNLMSEIEKSGKEFKNVENLDADVSTKLKTASVDPTFFDYCKRLLAAVVSPQTPSKVKAIAIGALLYFISPIDLIPDHIPVIGYLDDLAVLSLAVNTVVAAEAESAKKKVRAGDPSSLEG